MTRELLDAINIQAKREGYFLPVLRAIVFEQLGQNFPTKHLLDILDDHRGGNWGSDQGDGLLPAPSLRSPDIRHGSIDFSHAEIRYYTPTELKKHRLADGDILVIKSNGSLDLVGKSQLYSTTDDASPATASNFVLIISPDRRQVNPTYLDCFLKSPQALVWRVDKQRTTTGLRNLDADGYLATCIPLPPTQEAQKEIVEILDSIGDGVWQDNPHFDIRLAERAKWVSDAFEKLEAEAGHQQSLLAKLKQAILQEAIQGKLTADWRAANPDVEPASRLLQRIQAEKNRLIAAKKLRPDKPHPKITPTEIPFEIPKGWEWCRLGAVTRFFDYRGKTPNKISAGVRLITAKNVKFGRFSDMPRDYLSEESYSRHMVRGFPENGDILFTTEAPLGNACQLEMDERFALGQRIITIQPIISNKRLVLFAMLSLAIQSQLIEKASGITAKGIKSSRLIQVLLPLPPLAEQAAIVERVEALMATCRALEAEIEHARTHAAHLLQAILKEAFAPASGTFDSAHSAQATAPIPPVHHDAVTALVQSLRTKGSLTSSDAQTATGLDAAGVRPLLQRLVAEGHARVEGHKRGTRYVTT